MFIKTKRPTSLASGEFTYVIRHGQLLPCIVPMPGIVRDVSNNDTRRSQTQRWVALVAICVFIFARPSHAASYSSETIVSATNQARVEHGLPTLTPSDELQAAANAKAQDMFLGQYFSHVAPSGKQPWSYFSAHQYAYTAAGENLAIDFVAGEDIVPAWMQSPSHRENILNSTFHDIGVAVVDGTMNGQATTIVVEFFGSRISAQALVDVAVPTPDPTPTAPSAQVIPKLVTPPVAATEPAVAPAILATQPQPEISSPTPTQIPEQSEYRPTVRGLTTSLANPNPSFSYEDRQAALGEFIVLTLACAILTIMAAWASERIQRIGKDSAIPLPQVATT